MPKDILKWGPLRMPNLVNFFCYHNVEPKNEMATIKKLNGNWMMGEQARIFSRRPIWAFWGPKIPNRASWENVRWFDSWRVLGKSFFCWIFSRRPIWAFWGPKIPNRASWENVRWFDSWRVLGKILQVSFVGFSQDVQFELFGGQKFQIERLEKNQCRLDSRRVWAAFVWLNLTETSRDSSHLFCTLDLFI